MPSTPEEQTAAARERVLALLERHGWNATSFQIAPMGFLAQVEPFTLLERRRFFVAEVAGRIVGFLGIIPIYARGGWFFEDFLRDPAAPNGTIELRIDAGMRAAAAEQWQYGWVAFDVALCGALFALARRWRRPLADVVAIAITADAAITLAEAIAYNAPRVRGVADAVVIALAVLAPASAAGLLWSARIHRSPAD
jgi:hypothetical protein